MARKPGVERNDQTGHSDDMSTIQPVDSKRDLNFPELLWPLYPSGQKCPGDRNASTWSSRDELVGRVFYHSGTDFFDVGNFHELRAWCLDDIPDFWEFRHDALDQSVAD